MHSPSDSFPEKIVDPSGIVGSVGPWNEKHTIASHTHFDASSFCSGFA